MLRTLRLENFKIHENSLVQLGPVTLLAGLNSAGKSSVIQALLLLQENLGRAASMDMLLNGDWVELGRPKDIFSDNASSDTLSIRIEGDGTECELVGAFNKDSPIRITNTKNDPSLKKSIVSQYLCAERVGPRNNYPLNEMNPKIANGYLGVRGEFTFQYLAKIVTGVDLPNAALKHPSANSNGLFHNVEKWMGEISPGIRFQSQDDADGAIVVPSYYYARGGARRPGHVGFGLTYSLPIITAILSAKPGQLLLIENPEAHLNPQGQIAIARLIAKASEHVQIVIESHSDHILNGLCYAIAVDGVSESRMVFNYFYRDENTSKIEAILPKSNGRLPYWPEGFFDQYPDILTKIMRATN